MRHKIWLASILTLVFCASTYASDKAFNCPVGCVDCWLDGNLTCCIESTSPQGEYGYCIGTSEDGPIMTQFGTPQAEKPLTADDLAKLIEPLINLWKDRLQLEMYEECRPYNKEYMPDVCKPYVEK
jgi:hypothetical protein